MSSQVCSFGLGGLARLKAALYARLSPLPGGCRNEATNPGVLQSRLLSQFRQRLGAEVTPTNLPLIMLLRESKASDQSESMRGVAFLSLTSIYFSTAKAADLL